LSFFAGGVEAITARTFLWVIPNQETKPLSGIENRNSSSHFVLAAGNLICISCTFHGPALTGTSPDYVPSYGNRLAALLMKLAWPNPLSLHVLLTYLSELVLTRQIHATTLFAENEHHLTCACDAASASQMKPRTCKFGLSLVIFVLCPAYEKSCIILRMQAQPCLASVTSSRLRPP
jgi:hypothetical protein